MTYGISKVSSVLAILLAALTLSAQAGSERGPAFTPRVYGPQDPVRATARTILRGTVNNPAADTTSHDTQSSTALVSLGGGRLVAAFNDTGSLGTADQRDVGYAFSTDNGASWMDGGTVPPYNGVLRPVFPLLAADPAAKMVYMATATGAFARGLPVYRSSDGGQTWNGTPTDGVGHHFGPIRATFAGLATDLWAGSGRGNVYLCFFRNDLGMMNFTRSTDKAVSFTPPGATGLGSAQLAGCNVAVGPQHDVYVFFVQKPAATNQLVMRRSIDGGLSFGPAVVVRNLQTPLNPPYLPLAGGIAGILIPQVAINPDPLRPYIYVAYHDSPNAVTGADNGNIFVVYSKDRGATWSAPVTVSAGQGDQFYPAIGFASKGNLMVTYNSRSEDPANSYFQRRARIGKLTATGSIAFNTSFQLGPNTPNVTSQDPIPGTGSMESGLSDQVIGSGGKWMTTWADSRSGNAFHARQPDVRFAAIAAPVPSADLGITLTAATTAMAPLDQRLVKAHLTSTGGASNDVYLSVTLPTGMTVEPPGGLDCTTNGPFMDCSVGSIAAGGARDVYFLVRADGTAGTRLLKARASASSRDTAQANNLASKSLTVSTGAGVTTSYTTGNIAVGILDGSSVDIPIPVADMGTVLKVKAAVRLNHTSDEDVDIYLVDPAGQTIELSTDNGGVNDNYGSGNNDCTGTPTVFDDAAATSITGGAPPFAGSFKPEVLLSGLLGKAANGVWKLRVDDDQAGFFGTVGCVTLTVTRKP
jgi:subtilisin-like proprotein convertase family protein